MVYCIGSQSQGVKRGALLQGLACKEGAVRFSAAIWQKGSE